MSVMLNSAGLSGPGHMASIKLGRKKSEAHYPGAGGESSICYYPPPSKIKENI